MKGGGYTQKGINGKFPRHIAMEYFLKFLIYAILVFQCSLQMSIWIQLLSLSYNGSRRGGGCKITDGVTLLLHVVLDVVISMYTLAIY
jgi:hypothetical protein